MSVALDFPGTQILSQQFPIPYAEATSIAVCCHFWGHADPWFFPFFSIFAVLISAPCLLI